MGYDAQLLNLTAFKTISLATGAFPRPRRSEILDAASMVAQISYPAETDLIRGMQARPCAPSIAPALDTENEMVELATGGSASIATETLRADGARRGLSVAAIRSAHKGAARSTLLNVGMTTALTDTENGAQRDSLLHKEQRRQGTIAMHCVLGLFTEGESDFTKSEVAIEANFSIEARRAGVSLAFAEEGHEESLARRVREGIWSIAQLAHPRGECGHFGPSMD
ncbi:hypothetical protein [Aliirhizobium smilacinae]|uniref:Uncharacterized protein n=1 Tax=Aliirhizobium smilacinae TaxID=1395944 RepID=A0A5C4XA11_9HYPH|nr:hypothetical protein [Rhizobium smilacinae]TNM60325.1 hypothetical protein FHP24_26385 [Rhizobium smilacinae]